MRGLITKSALTLAVAAIGAAGCATMGTGTGATLSGADPVTFTWKGSTVSDSGTMTASLPDGKTIDTTFPKT